jgi:hypothetical protein
VVSNGSDLATRAPTRQACSAPWEWLEGRLQVAGRQNVGPIAVSRSGCSGHRCRGVSVQGSCWQKRQPGMFDARCFEVGGAGVSSFVSRVAVTTVATRSRCISCCQKRSAFYLIISKDTLERRGRKIQPKSLGLVKPSGRVHCAAGFDPLRADVRRPADS